MKTTTVHKLMIVFLGICLLFIAFNTFMAFFLLHNPILGGIQLAILAICTFQFVQIVKKIKLYKRLYGNREWDE